MKKCYSPLPPQKSYVNSQYVLDICLHIYVTCIKLPTYTTYVLFHNPYLKIKIHFKSSIHLIHQYNRKSDTFHFSDLRFKSNELKAKDLQNILTHTHQHTHTHKHSLKSMGGDSEFRGCSQNFDRQPKTPRTKSDKTELSESPTWIASLCPSDRWTYRLPSPQNNSFSG